MFFTRDRGPAAHNGTHVNEQGSDGPQAAADDPERAYITLAELWGAGTDGIGPEPRFGPPTMRIDVTLDERLLLDALRAKRAASRAHSAALEAEEAARGALEIREDETSAAWDALMEAEGDYDDALEQFEHEGEPEHAGLDYCS